MSAPLIACTLAIKAVPIAPRNAVVGWLADALKVKLHAPALEGRANDQLCEFIADALALPRPALPCPAPPRRAVTLLQGAKSRQKVLRISGLTLAEVRFKLGV